MANFITGIRIVCGILLIFFPVLSPIFYALYITAGFTDMIDGMIARKLNTASEFGAKLDTAADLIFVVVCFAKYLPVLKLSLYIYVWIAIIAFIKVLDFTVTFLKEKKYTAKHTILNKVTGGLLFALPFTLSFVDLKYTAVIVCISATAAAVEPFFKKFIQKIIYKFHKYIEK